MTNDHAHPFGAWCSVCDDEQWGGAERWRHCTHPEQDWCDCDWCRLIRTPANNGTIEAGLVRHQRLLLDVSHDKAAGGAVMENTFPVESEWGESENRFEFACGCLFYRTYRSFRGVDQWRLRTDPCPVHQKEVQS